MITPSMSDRGEPPFQVILSEAKMFSIHSAPGRGGERCLMISGVSDVRWKKILSCSDQLHLPVAVTVVGCSMRCGAPSPCSILNHSQQLCSTYDLGLPMHDQQSLDIISPPLMTTRHTPMPKIFGILVLLLVLSSF